MRWICLDCKESFLGPTDIGYCPACGSFNIEPVINGHDLDI